MLEQLSIRHEKFQGRDVYIVIHNDTNHMVSVYTDRDVAERFALDSETWFDFKGYIKAVASGADLTQWVAKRKRLEDRSRHITFDFDYWESKTSPSREAVAEAYWKSRCER